MYVRVSVMQDIIVYNDWNIVYYVTLSARRTWAWYINDKFDIASDVVILKITCIISCFQYFQKFFYVRIEHKGSNENIIIFSITMILDLLLRNS